MPSVRQTLKRVSLQSNRLRGVMPFASRSYSRFSLKLRRAVKSYLSLALLSVLILTPQPALANNGPQFIGFSAESTALAGSGHVAVADTSAINTNPAALSLIQGTRFDVTAGFLQAFLHHSDVFGNNNVAGQNNVYALGNLGAATRIAAVPGLKFAIGLSYEATDKLSFGIAPSVGYSDVSLRLFPGTSVPPSPGLPTGFAGFNIRDSCARNGGLGPLGGDCPSDVVFGVKVGAMYRALPWVTVGATYTSPVKFTDTNGQATLNFSAFGLGTVNYDARVTGIKWPQQVDVSMAAKPMEQVRVTLTTSWLNWATINNVEITATNPSNALAPSQVNLTFPFNWKDQVVVALGVSYALMQESSWKDKNRLVLRAGYNYSNIQFRKRR